MEKPELYSLRRIGASYFDMMIVGMFVLILGEILQPLTRANISHTGLLLGPVFTAILTYYWNTTPGKKVAKLEVVSSTPNKKSFLSYLGRETCRWAPGLILPLYTLINTASYMDVVPERLDDSYHGSYFHYQLAQDPFNPWTLLLLLSPGGVCALYGLNIFNPPMFYDRWFGFKVVTKEPSEIKTAS